MLFVCVVVAVLRFWWITDEDKDKDWSALTRGILREYDLTALTQESTYHGFQRVCCIFYPPLSSPGELRALLSRRQPLSTSAARKHSGLESFILILSPTMQDSEVPQTWQKTPLIFSDILSAKLDCNVYLKLEVRRLVSGISIDSVLNRRDAFIILSVASTCTPRTVSNNGPWVCLLARRSRSMARP